MHCQDSDGVARLFLICIISDVVDRQGGREKGHSIFRQEGGAAADELTESGDAARRRSICRIVRARQPCECAAATHVVVQNLAAGVRRSQVSRDSDVFE